MKKISIVLLVCSTLLLAACSTEKQTEPTDSTAKQEMKVNKTEDATKMAEKKKQVAEAEKKKQEEISKKVLAADTATKAAEINPTDDTILAAKKAVEAIPGGNNELIKRLETVTANLEAIKQQAIVQTQSPQQQIVTEQVQQQATNSDLNFIDEDNNGFDDRSPFNDPAARAEYARGEAEAQRQWEQGQANIQNGVDPNGNELLPGQDHAAGSNPDGTPDAWVQGQLDRITPDGGYQTDEGVIYPE